MAVFNDTGLLPEGKGLARRGFIAGAAMACVVPAAPVGAVVAGDTPVLRLYREYMALRAESVWADDVDVETYYALFDTIESQIATMPSTCMADFAAKMLVAHCDGDYSQLAKDDPVWIEARALVEGIA